MSYYAGIDVGALTADAVIINAEKKIISWSIIPTGTDSAGSGKAALRQAVEKAGIDLASLKMVVSTGYSRKRIAEAKAEKTEISCHAKGMIHLYPEVRTLIDIGGQDSKAISVSANGKVVDFAMNDKCAAGTGRFLEVMAHALSIELDELSSVAMKHKKELSLSSTCTVFAESEVVSLISQGYQVEDIAHAMCRAIASRTAGLVKRVGVQPLVAMSGGVAKSFSVVKALEKILSLRIIVPDEPQIIGALGAALYAIEM